MFEKAKSGRDAFTFSLGGVTAIAPFMAAPILADDRINRILGERLQQAREACGPTLRSWPKGRRDGAHDCA